MQIITVSSTAAMIDAGLVLGAGDGKNHGCHRTLQQHALGARQHAPAINRMKKLGLFEICGAGEVDQTNSFVRKRHKASNNMITTKSAAYRLKKATSFRFNRVPSRT